jgi:hypothetical protein
MADEVDYWRVLVICAAVGAAVGLVSSIPVVRWPNLCCLWIAAGGFACAYILGRSVRSVEVADGVIVGAVFGLVYGVVVNVFTFIVNIPLNILGLGSAVRGMEGGGILATLGIKLGFGMLGSLLIVAGNIFLGVVFGALGGLAYAYATGYGRDEPSWKRHPGGRRPSLRR